MRLIQSHADFRVYDDVLPAAKFSQVWRYVQVQDFEFVQRERWFKVWRLDDGEPLWGPEVVTAGAAASLAAGDSTEHADRSSASRRVRAKRRRKVGPHLDNDAENRALLTRGVGRFVHAKPNRLVILCGGTPHMIKAVTAAAGNHVRCSIAGFFIGAR
jgi:hypothetical protein